MGSGVGGGADGEDVADFEVEAEVVEAEVVALGTVLEDVAIVQVVCGDGAGRG